VNRFSAFLGAAGAFVILFAACGGKVVVDASDTGGAGGMGSSISTADGAPDTTSVVASAAVTTGSGGPCDPTYTCAEAITPPDVDPGKLCQGSVSAALYDAMIQCACVDACAFECGDTACVGVNGSPSCKACIQDPATGCLPQLEACANDV
jgi:hypothetical protein